MRLSLNQPSHSIGINVKILTQTYTLAWSPEQFILAARFRGVKGARLVGYCILIQYRNSYSPDLNFKKLTARGWLCRQRL